MQIIDRLFPGDLARLARDLGRASARAYPGRRLRAALAAIATCFPVYRSYVDAHGASTQDRRLIGGAVRAAGRLLSASERPVVKFAGDVLAGEIAGVAARAVAMRFQQFTAPAMAKSLEDTAFYRYNRLVSLNEVGGDPGRFGLPVAQFHARMARQRRDWPRTMLATATHDTKRGEDARARLNVLSEIPVLWGRQVAQWGRLNATHRRRLTRGPSPSPNDEHLIYQAMLGAFPMTAASGRAELAALATRLKTYIVKATREAKLRTSWSDPDLEYEAACARFIDRLLALGRANRFLRSFLPFQQRIAQAGARNSLAQTVVKLTAPGVPDIYQGCEGWDLSLVDPDNRRPVDFTRRAAGLDEIDALGVASRVSALDWRDERTKLTIVTRLLRLRSAYPEMFSSGDYRPLRVAGRSKNNVVAFARRQGDRILIVAAGRFFADRAAWRGDLMLDPAWRGRWFGDVLGGHAAAPAGHRGLPLSELFGDLPAAVLLSESGR